MKSLTKIKCLKSRLVRDVLFKESSQTCLHYSVWGRWGDFDFHQIDFSNRQHPLLIVMGIPEPNLFIFEQSHNGRPIS